MPYGLRVWDETGKLLVDYPDRLGRTHSVVSVASLGARGSSTVSVPGYSLDGTWFYSTNNAPYVEVRAQAGGFSIFNTNYYGSSSVFNIYVFRG